MYTLTLSLAGLASASALVAHVPVSPTAAVRAGAPAHSLLASPTAGRTLRAARAGKIYAAEAAEPEEIEEMKVSEAAAESAPLTPPKGWKQVPEEELWGPDKKADMRIEGGSTLKTFKMPADAERVQYILTSPNGRPVKAKVELWIGPIRCVHELIYDCMGGMDFPLRATLQFKKLAPVLKVSTDGSYEFPLECGVFVPEPEESKQIGETCKDMFYSAPLKDRVQGGSTIDDKGGAIRTFDVPPTWEKTQIMVWSKDVGKKSFKTNIEILQGPNNAKQFLNLRCGGSTQPYHAVIDTPGAGWMIRCNSKKYLEDGLFEIAVAPYGEVLESAAPPAVTLGGW